ncbi:hypothetical protein BU17DRAFT_60260 [Hysterangium stoloniferum]|nr:hypothetical protein BU17DRAFT_60260 [Hysterangium stoloniferum]
MSSSHTINIQALSLNIENHHAAVYSNIAGYTLLIETEACGTQLYDHFLNLGEEIDLIWSTPWNAGKILYYATKYPAFLDGAFLLYCTTPNTCGLLYKLSGVMMVVGIVIAEFFRTWAVWGQNNKVMISLLCAELLMGCLTGYFVYHGFSPITFGPSPSGVDFVCWIATPLGKTIFLNYIVVVIFETIILVLTILKCLQHLRIRRSRLIVTLYQDGVMYYVYLIVQALAQPHTRDFHAILTARILVNLRKAARDNCKDSNALTTTDRGRTNFSSVILGVDTWFHNPNAITQMAEWKISGIPGDRISTRKEITLDKLDARSDTDYRKLLSACLGSAIYERQTSAPRQCQLASYLVDGVSSLAEKTRVSMTVDIQTLSADSFTYRTTTYSDGMRALQFINH